MSTTLHLNPAESSIVVKDDVLDVARKLQVAKINADAVVHFVGLAGQTLLVPADSIVYAEGRA